MTIKKSSDASEYDVTIIGGGISGCLTAFRLSKYNISICLIEKESDLAMGATGANSAIVHSGYDPVPGTLKAKYNVEGNRLFPELCLNLGVPFKKNGSLVIAFNNEEHANIVSLMDRGIRNEVSGLKIITGEQAKNLEPMISKNVTSALYAPTGGIVCPYELTFAAGEVAFANGTDFLFDHEVIEIQKSKSSEKTNPEFIITCKKSSDEKLYTIKTRAIVNAAGTFADKISNMVGDDSFKITPRRGEYSIVDKQQGHIVKHTIFQTPTDKGKGVLVTPAVDENIIVGPNSNFVDNPENTTTTSEGLIEIWLHALRSVPSLNKKYSIRDFAGVRATPTTHDFVIGEHPDIPGFFRVAGIESPGLTAAPAFSLTLEQEIINSDVLNSIDRKIKKRNDVVLTRDKPVYFRKLSLNEQGNFLKINPLYANVICRCENITEQEILDAINRTIGEVTVNGIKMRTRAGMGRCQGGFCLPKVIDLISRETSTPAENITLSGPGSKILTGRTR